MAAVIAPHPRPTPSRRPPAEPTRPPLRVIPGGRQAARAYARHARPVRPLHPAVYRRRRLGVLVAALSLALVGYLALTGLGVVLGQGRASAGAVTASATGDAAPPSAAGAAPATTYVVQPGDTLWSIARHLRPSGDVRPLVDALAARAGGSGLQAGQRLSLDGLVD